MAQRTDTERNCSYNRHEGFSRYAYQDNIVELRKDNHRHTDMKTRVLLVDDHAIIREALRSLLEEQLCIEVVGDTDDSRKALDLVREKTPNIVIIDVTIRDLNAIEVTRSITHEFPDAKVIALSVHCEKGYIVNMFSAGATGYLLKQSSFDELIPAIRTVAAGGHYLSSGIDIDFIKSSFKSHYKSIAVNMTKNSACIDNRDKNKNSCAYKFILQSFCLVF